MLFPAPVAAFVLFVLGLPRQTQRRWSRLTLRKSLSFRRELPEKTTIAVPNRCHRPCFHRPRPPRFPGRAHGGVRGEADTFIFPDGARPVQRPRRKRRTIPFPFPFPFPFSFRTSENISMQYTTNHGKPFFLTFSGCSPRMASKQRTITPLPPDEEREPLLKGSFLYFRNPPKRRESVAFRPVATQAQGKSAADRHETDRNRAGRNTARRARQNGPVRHGTEEQTDGNGRNSEGKKAAETERGIFS